MGAEFITVERNGKMNANELCDDIANMIRNYDPREDMDCTCGDDYDDEDDGDHECQCFDQGYTGTWAEVEPRCSVGSCTTFKSYNAAEEWLSNNCIKWEGAKAVRYYTDKVSAETREIIRSDAKLKTLADKYNKLKDELSALKQKPRTKMKQKEVEKKMAVVKKAHETRKDKIVATDSGTPETSWLVGALASC